MQVGGKVIRSRINCETMILGETEEEGGVLWIDRWMRKMPTKCVVSKCNKI